MALDYAVMSRSAATGLQDYERRELAERVAQGVDSVRRRGDEALREHTRRAAASPPRAASVAVGDEIAQAIPGADLVVEAVTEDLEIKRGVHAECDAAAEPDAIIATNTSALDINALASFVSSPERCIGMHWFNPPEWTPGVEVVPGERTAPEVADRSVALLRGSGKRPSVVAGSVGCIVNRLQMALLCGAARCVAEGLASPRDIDEVVRSCFGFRLLLRAVPDRGHGGARRLRGGDRAAPAPARARRALQGTVRCCARSCAPVTPAPPAARASMSTSRARRRRCSSSVIGAAPR